MCAAGRPANENDLAYGQTVINPTHFRGCPTTARIAGPQDLTECGFRCFSDLEMSISHCFRMGKMGGGSIIDPPRTDQFLPAGHYDESQLPISFPF